MNNPFELQYSTSLSRAYEAALANAGHDSYKFHRVGLDLDEVDDADLDLSMNLIEEEIGEFFEAVESKSKAEVTKELCDCLVVLLRFAVKYDLPINEAYKRVYENNMGKTKVLSVREDGKVTKPHDYPKVNLHDFFD